MVITPQGLRPRAHHHHAALRLHGEDHAGHRHRWSATPTRMEFFIAWYSGNPYELFTFINRAFGPYAWAYWTMVTCNVLVAAALLVQEGAHQHARAVRDLDLRQHRHVVRALRDHRDLAAPRLPALVLGHFTPTIWDVATLLGSFGLFFTLFCLFVRFLPMVATAEVKSVLPQADPHHAGVADAAIASSAGRRTDGACCEPRLPPGDALRRCSPSSRRRRALPRLRGRARRGLHPLGRAHAVPGARPGAAMGLKRSHLPWIVLVHGARRRRRRLRCSRAG